MGRLAAYVRVSSEKQKEEGMSLEVQEAQLIKYAALYEIDLLDIIVDGGESAKDLERPGMLKIMELMDKGVISGVMVTKLDRLTRSVRDLCYLLEKYFSKGKTLISVQEKIDTDSATGRMITNVLMSVSQWEREVIGERTKAVLTHKKALGERVGNIPYGKKLSADGVHLEDNHDECVIINTVMYLRNKGITFRDVCKQINVSGNKNRQGNPFTLSAVHRMVTS